MKLTASKTQVFASLTQPSVIIDRLKPQCLFRSTLVHYNSFKMRNQETNNALNSTESILISGHMTGKDVFRFRSQR